MSAKKKNDESKKKLSKKQMKKLEKAIRKAAKKLGKSLLPYSDARGGKTLKKSKAAKKGQRPAGAASCPAASFKLDLGACPCCTNAVRFPSRSAAKVAPLPVRRGSD